MLRCSCTWSCCLYKAHISANNQTCGKQNQKMCVFSNYLNSPSSLSEICSYEVFGMFYEKWLTSSKLIPYWCGKYQHHYHQYIKFENKTFNCICNTECYELEHNDLLQN